jgi:hypothetical protein
MKRLIALLVIGIACSIAGSAFASHITITDPALRKLLVPAPQNTTPTAPPCVADPVFISATTRAAILTAAVKLRIGPGSQCPSAGTAPQAQHVTATCGPARAHPSTGWCRVETPNGAGWVALGMIAFQ